MSDRLDLLARFTEDPKIHHLIKKAKLVKVEAKEDGIHVSTLGHSNSWIVRRSQDRTEVYCTCPAFRFNKDKPKTCKHLTAVCAMLNEEDIPVYVPKKKRKALGTESID